MKSTKNSAKKPDRNRRKVLKMLPALAVAAPARSLAGSRPVDDHILAAALLEAFAEPESARLLGAAYLAERPHDGSAEKLMAHLKADLDLVAWYREGGGKAGLQQRLQARAAIDYGNDECLEAAGCYLSVTELRLCALSTFA